MVTRKKSTAKAPVKKVKKAAERVTHKKVEVSTPTEVTNGTDVVATITDAAVPVETKPVAEPITPKAYEYSVDNLPSLLPLIRDCWDEVRQGDAPFDECAPEFRQTLLAHTISVLTTSAVLRGDSHLARFESAVAKIKSRQGG